jgi:hypothetical protein
MQETQVETDTRSILAGATRCGHNFDLIMPGTQVETETKSTLEGATRRGQKFRLQYARNTG